MADATLIGPQTHIQGAISGDGALRVAGRVDGEVTLSDLLTVEEGGVVAGTVTVREAHVHGRLEGTLTASERLVLAPTAQVIGTLSAPIIRMEDGALFKGELLMDIDGPAPTVTSSAATPRASSTSTSSAARPTSFTTPRSAAPAAPARPTPPASTPVSVTPSRTAPTSAPAVSSPAASAPLTTSATTVAVVVEEPVEEEILTVEAPVEEEGQIDRAASETLAQLSDEALAEYEEQTVKELREELRRRDLPVSGTKQELIERLVQSQPEPS